MLYVSLAGVSFLGFFRARSPSHAPASTPARRHRPPTAPPVSPFLLLLLLLRGSLLLRHNTRIPVRDDLRQVFHTNRSDRIPPIQRKDRFNLVLIPTKRLPEMSGGALQLAERQCVAVALLTIQGNLRRTEREWSRTEREIDLREIAPPRQPHVATP